jgi:hypothetical protein
MDTNICTLFVGDEVTDPGEQRLISRLRRDLAMRGDSVTLYANFFPASRAGQIDLLVRSSRRTAHIEIKTLNPGYPVFGRLNGHWEQQLPDGSRRSLSKNAAKQALNGTWAISDAMREFAQQGDARSSDFKRHIDTLVGIWERIPAGSEIETPAHVNVVGYGELLDRLTSPGPMVDWNDKEWDAFARHLGLFQPDPASPVDVQQRSAVAAVTDYRLRAQVSFSAELGSIVDLGADGPTGHLGLEELGRLVADGGIVALVGPSGSGKSLAGLHVAVRHCEAGCLVIRIRAGEYEQGRFSNLLARAMAPFSKEPWGHLTQLAQAAGIPLTVVLDGLNECPADFRLELLNQLRAFLNRYPSCVLITSTEDSGVSDILGATVLVPTSPDDVSRRELLDLHGAKHPDRISAQFQTPYELSIAAQCESELEDDSSLADLHAAYIRKFAPTEQLRSGLRALATRLHEQLRSSLPFLEAITLLNSQALGMTPREVDRALACPLLEVRRQRIHFRHELLGLFLAAEDLVQSAASGADLGRQLVAPANKLLAGSALAIEADPHRTLEALENLADTSLLLAGLNGEYGTEVAQLVHERVRDILHLGVAATDTERVELRSDSFFGGWKPDVPWTPIEQALLAVAGQALMQGRFVAEVCELLDRTDAVCLHNASQLEADGSDSPISVVVASTYNQVRPADGQGLAASYVAAAFELTSMMSRFGPDRPVAGLARRLADSESPYPWGRLYLASLSVDPQAPQDQATFTIILRRAWNAGGYHLQFVALRAAEYFATSDEPYRTEILDVVKSFQASHWALQSSIVEVLSRFGEIDSGLTSEDLREQIREMLDHRDASEACQAAARIVSNQFEDENIVGPYYEAIAGLTSTEKVRLLTMAAEGSDIAMSMSLDWTLDKLGALVPTGDPSLDELAKKTFGAYLNGPPNDAVMPIEATRACLAAIRGWAKFDDALPRATNEPSDEERNWRLVAGLLLSLERHDGGSDQSETWRQLHQDPCNTVLTLSTLEGAATWDAFQERRPALHDLYEAHASELRHLFEWALDHLESIPAHRVRRGGAPDHYVIRALGQVGDLNTAQRLRLHTLDPEAGAIAVAAIRQIHQRHET